MRWLLPLLAFQLRLAVTLGIMKQPRYSTDLKPTNDTLVVTFCQGSTVSLVCESTKRVMIHEAIYDWADTEAYAFNCSYGVTVSAESSGYGCMPFDVTQIVSASCENSECSSLKVLDENLIPEEELTRDDLCSARRVLTVAYCCFGTSKNSTPARTTTVKKRTTTKTTITSVPTSTIGRSITRRSKLQIAAAQQKAASSQQLSAAGVQGALQELETLAQDTAGTLAEMNEEQRATMLRDVMVVASNLVAQPEGWQALQDRTQATNTLLGLVDQVGFRALALGYEVHMETEKVLLVTRNVNASSSVNDAGMVQLGTETVVLATGNDTMQVVLAQYRDAKHLFQAKYTDAGADANTLPPRFDLASSVLSVQTQPVSTFRNGQPIIRFTVKLQTTGLPVARTCAFWRPDTGRWSTQGCRNAGYNETHVVCECTHLTSFAVLVDYTGATALLSVAHRDALRYITIVGTALSCVSLLLLIVALFVLRSLKASRANKINRHLSITLLAALLLYLIASLYDFAQLGETACRVVAAGLHYLFLAAFGWFAVEGVHLYITLVLVFSPRRSELIFRLFCAAAYGLPACIVGATAGGWPHAYGAVAGGDFCWLRAEGGYVWAFLGPVCAVMLTNMGSFGVALRVVCSRPKVIRATRSITSKRDTSNSTSATSSGSDGPSNDRLLQSERTEDSECEVWTEFKKWCKSSFILVNLLGLSWAVGLLYFGEETLVFAYLFTLINSCQGVLLLIVYVGMDKKTHRDVRRLIDRSSSQGSASVRRSVTSSSTAHVAKISRVQNDLPDASSPTCKKYAVNCTPNKAEESA